jgi:protein disulfide-isomerase A1
MLNSKLSVFLLLLSLTLCHSEEFPSEEGVLVLTDDNFAHALEHHPNMLVEFYAPWCGHCKTLAPEYAKAAQSLEKGDITVKLAKVDATIHKVVAEKFEVKGFPTLIFFKNGVQSEYTGGSNITLFLGTEQTIVNWLKKKVGA